MDQVQSVFAVICPEHLISAPQRVDDHQPRQFKAHRLNELVKRIDQVKGDIATLLHRSYSQLHRMKLSTGVSPYRRYDRGYSERWDEEVLDNINSTIICSKGSESDLAEDRWRYQVLGMDVELRDIIRLVDPVVNRNTVLSFEDYRLRPRRKLVYGPLIQLMKSMIPLIKLSRLFFHKLIEQIQRRRKQLSLLTE
ncbi:hypothetical protein Pst134EA_020844 [Puccinia striiformis f. sp. tritici]|uniref:hypothetical protein n=1 Tax=Puccinia striiformis f. sp. tritici TaxID=168172 RepID=UPI002007A05B|nr:hypothetical protein Pst134EA_020844 [Puccinia striiformis f. sp. tritici]KAH9456936.1 hypothetical protein Pst134EA_020844 [Puccinia striiformis f. sp. tritici]KAI9620217.1 hypothetical protein H4Q26_013785 [Puccinia striiformis f. sp. tritici PST-130]